VTTDVTEIDLTFTDHGWILLLRSHTSCGACWIGEHIPAEARRWRDARGRDAVVVEPRYVEAIACGAVADGLLVSVD
jgi:hypothetical protein